MKSPNDIESPEPGVYLVPVYNQTPEGIVRSNDEYEGCPSKGIEIFDPSSVVRPGVMIESLLEVCSKEIERRREATDGLSRKEDYTSAMNYISFAMIEIRNAEKTT